MFRDDAGSLLEASRLRARDPVLSDIPADTSFRWAEISIDEEPRCSGATTRLAGRRALRKQGSS